jgi:hypothetical protein
MEKIMDGGGGAKERARWRDEGAREEKNYEREE